VNLLLYKSANNKRIIDSIGVIGRNDEWAFFGQEMPVSQVRVSVKNPNGRRHNYFQEPINHTGDKGTEGLAMAVTGKPFAAAVCGNGFHEFFYDSSFFGGRKQNNFLAFVRAASAEPFTAFFTLDEQNMAPIVRAVFMYVAGCSAQVACTYDVFGNPLANALVKYKVFSDEL